MVTPFKERGFLSAKILTTSCVSLDIEYLTFMLSGVYIFGIYGYKIRRYHIRLCDDSEASQPL